MQCHLALFAAWLLVLTPFAEAQTTNDGADATDINWTVLTNTHRDTLEGFINLRDALEVSLMEYEKDKSKENFQTLRLVGQQISSLIDLPQGSNVLTRSTGAETFTSMFDIFARIGYPDPEAAPGREELKASGATVYSIPKTPFRIVKVADGDTGAPVRCINKLIVPNDPHDACLNAAAVKGKPNPLLHLSNKLYCGTCRARISRISARAPAPWPRPPVPSCPRPNTGNPSAQCGGQGRYRSP